MFISKLPITDRTSFLMVELCLLKTRFEVLKDCSADPAVEPVTPLKTNK